MLFGRPLRLVPFLLSCVYSAGCGGELDRVGNTVPVAGKVTVNDRPLTTGTVSFWPDASRGNSGELQPMAPIDAEGNYQLITFGKDGAPLGWYKVVVMARENIPSPQGPPVPMGKLLINDRYGGVETTDLVVEVVEQSAAGAYDLKLTR